MSEIELRHKVREQTGPMQKEMPLLVRVRLSFWEEYERAARSGEKMDCHRIYRGTYRQGAYYKLYDKYPALLPWVVCPLAGFLLERKELEFMAQERMLEVLSVSAVKGDGRCDSRWAKIQLEMYRELQDRIHGPVVQKVQTEQKNLNVNVDATGRPAELAAQSVGLVTDVAELDRRIAEIRAKREALQSVNPPAQVIDQQKLMRPDVLDAEIVDK